MSGPRLDPPVDLDEEPACCADAREALTLAARDLAESERKRQALVDVLRAICDRSVDTAPDSGGWAMAKVRVALLDKARAALAKAGVKP
jgi:hypothetical protein